MSTHFSGTTHTFTYGQHEITLETGKMARQAQGAVLLCCGATKILATVCTSANTDPSRNFFPLTVNYQEKAYAGGKIPGGFFKREGRPTESETLTSRLIDRSLRPLFHDNFFDDVQVITTLLSFDVNSADTGMLAILASSAALAVSGLPFQGPVASAHVGYINDTLQLNPTREELENSSLILIAASTQGAIHMVESEAQQLSEEIMLQALDFAQKQGETAIQAIQDFAKLIDNKEYSWEPLVSWTEELYNAVSSAAMSAIVAAFQITEKSGRSKALKILAESMVEQFANDENHPAPMIKRVLHDLEKTHVRKNLLSGQPRIDGRDTKTVRPIGIELGLLNGSHGSALFTRGETQALASLILGSDRDAQMIDDLSGQDRNTFMLHYNFPPFSTGETGFVGSPKRREIGHGRLAKRALLAVMPAEEEFPYTLRIVSEVLESNGSSSQATVCSASLALMDAGVPIAAPVSGIAMGLIKDGDNFVILSDILGDEDHLGDMDFKVAGTINGVTALQMDIKITGIDQNIMTAALNQAQEGRLHILNCMNEVIDTPRKEVADNAPKMITMQINSDKIRDVIGKGGATIRELTEKHGVTIDISDDGIIKIAAADRLSAEAAQENIIGITSDIEVGQIFESTVVKVLEFGAFVSLVAGKKDGFLHISQILPKKISDINDEIKEGQTIKVKVIEIDRQGRIKVSARVLLEDDE
jgi:polyribonucleotide nucleotidyltransferase